MTCEVAVMNKRGVALAADSAVTLGDVRKIYHTAEKLFQLSSSAPVGIMTYGSADMMGVPWETVIKIYTRKLGERRFERLDQYANDFLNFLQGEESLFPEQVQKQWVTFLVGSYWKNFFLDQLDDKLQQADKTSAKAVNSALLDLISQDHRRWTYPPIEELGPSYKDHLLSDYASCLDKAEKDLFSSLHLSEEVRQGLRTTFTLMYTQKWLHPQELSGVVISGMGDSEPFPAVLHYQVGTIIGGRLRFIKQDEARVGQNEEDSDAFVMPFATTKMIDLFYEGISEEVKEKLGDIISHCIVSSVTKKGKESSSKLRAKVEQKVLELLKREIQENYTSPLLEAVAALPRHELAGLAETLVSLTAFRARMSVAEEDTVAGPIDVAVISKGDGFVWIKRKDPVRGPAPVY